MGPQGLTRELDAYDRIAVDTAPLSYFLAGEAVRAPLARLVLAGAAQGKLTLVISVVTEAELLVLPLQAQDAEAGQAVEELIDGTPLHVVEVSRSVARTAAGLRARLGLKLPDSIVAATAIESACGALLGNDAAFGRLGAQLPYLHLDEYVGGR